MPGFEVGDRVRIDIPDETDPDYKQFHGTHGDIVDILEDDAGETTGDPRDSAMFSVKLEDGRVEEFRWRDLRPDPVSTDERN